MSEPSHQSTMAEPFAARQQAERFRGLAREITDETTHQALIELAEEYEARARAADKLIPRQQQPN